MRRTLQEYVEDPICDLFLDGDQKPVLRIDIDEHGKKLKLTSSDTPLTRFDTHLRFSLSTEIVVGVPTVFFAFGRKQLYKI